MSYVEVKTIKNNEYAYLRDSYREPVTQKVKHHHLAYLGRVSGITDRSVSVERIEPISKPVKEAIAVKVKESVIPSTDKKKAKYKVDIPIFPARGREERFKEQLRKPEIKEIKKKKEVKRKLIIPTEEELKNKEMFPIDI